MTTTWRILTDADLHRVGIVDVVDGPLHEDQFVRHPTLEHENKTQSEAPSVLYTHRPIETIMGTEYPNMESSSSGVVEDTKNYMETALVHSSMPLLAEKLSDRKSQSSEETSHQGEKSIGDVSSLPIESGASIPSYKRTLLAQKIMQHAQKGSRPTKQSEVHIIGEVVSGRDFGPGCFACKWSIDHGEGWTHLEGSQLDQTQIDCLSSSQASIIWAHPIDLHFTTTTMKGWPRILLQTWRIDALSKANVVGYGFIHVPMAPGSHTLEVSMWRPMGSYKTELVAACFGHTTELDSDEILYNNAWTERSRLRTIATGKVKLRLDVILRNFDLCEMLL
uniref:B9 domain-containing protein 2 n=1 Tax=Albugo laibachii Nc14 TaxID=890382 RepID=F0WJE7_9STRA|nr:conserved hypothetical protein [Albugo laibachii Nc14]|eukprot:CCA21395.1 conserved hypothetical protein [Albugo laibachii Nc14]